jgi:hypothetical protein
MLDFIFEKTGLDLEPKEVLYKAKNILEIVQDNIVVIKDEVEVKILETKEKFTK